MSGYGLTFPNLLDSANAVYNHYTPLYNSDIWLLDRNGIRFRFHRPAFNASAIIRDLERLDNL